MALDLVPISQLSAAATLTGAEQVPVVQTAVTVRTTIAAILAAAASRVQNVTAQITYQAAANANGATFDVSMSNLTSQSVGTSSFPAKNFATRLGGIDRQLMTTAASANSSAATYNAQAGVSVQRAFSGGVGGGFSMGWVFGPVTQAAGQRFFCGAVPRNSDPCLASDPSAKTNIIGIGKDAADLNVQFIYNDGAGTATKIDLGVVWTTLAGKALSFSLDIPSGGGSAVYRLTNLDTGTVYSGTLSSTTDLPAVDTDLNPHCGVNTGAGSSAISIATSVWSILKTP